MECLSYLVPAETVCNLLLPAETFIHGKWLPAESVQVNLLPAKTLQEAQLWRQSRQEAIFCGQYSPKEARDHGQSHWKPCTQNFSTL